MEFVGAKIVLLIGDRLLTLLRDDIPTIPYPGWWDMPGGGREGGESPEACVLRETREEFGLVLGAELLAWRAVFDSPTTGGQAVWFAARLPRSAERDIAFGDEGQGWLSDVARGLARASARDPAFQVAGPGRAGGVGGEWPGRWTGAGLISGPRAGLGQPSRGVSAARFAATGSGLSARRPRHRDCCHYENTLSSTR